MRDGWNHQATIRAGPADSLDRPKPVCHDPPQERTGIVDWPTFLLDLGLYSLPHESSLRRDSCSIGFPQTEYMTKHVQSHP